MEIKTRLNKGDKVWFMYNNKPREAIIKGLTVEFDNVRWNDLTIIKYFFDIEEMICLRKEISMLERDCFSSKEELIKSL